MRRLLAGLRERLVARERSAAVRNQLLQVFFNITNPSLNSLTYPHNALNQTAFFLRQVLYPLPNSSKQLPLLDCYYHFRLFEVPHFKHETV